MVRAEAVSPAAAPGPAPILRICVAHSPQAGRVEEVGVSLPPGATVQDALRASGLAVAADPASWPALQLGVWGRRCSLDEPLQDQDRVEIYRPLQVDPKEARRLRARGAR